jgi:hypothetical protein
VGDNSCFSDHSDQIEVYFDRTNYQRINTGSLKDVQMNIYAYVKKVILGIGSLDANLFIINHCYFVKCSIYVANP